MPRIELFARPDCADARAISEWLHAEGHTPLWRNLAEPGVADDLRCRTHLGIAPVTLVDGRPVWGESPEQLRRLRRMLGRKRWTFPW